MNPLSFLLPPPPSFPPSFLSPPPTPPYFIFFICVCACAAVCLFLHEKRGIGRGVLRGNSAAAAAGGEAAAAAAAMPRRKQQAPRRSAGNTLRLPRWGAAGTAGEGLTRREASPRGERFLQPCRRFKTPRVAASGGLGLGAEGGGDGEGGSSTLVGKRQGL